MENNMVENNKRNIKHVNILYLISSLLQFIVAFSAAFIIGIVIAIYMVFNQNADFDRLLDLSSYLVIPWVEIIAIFLPVLIFIKIKKLNYKNILKLNKIKLFHVIPLIIIGIAVQFVGMFLNNIVIFLLQHIGRVPLSSIPVPQNIIQLIFLGIIIGIIPSIFEELLVRGVMFSAYEKISIKFSIVMTALLFAIMHFNITNFVFPFFLGLILAYVVYLTDSIYASIIVHFVNNTLGVLILYIFNPPAVKYFEPVATYTLFQLLIVASVALVLIFASLYFIYKTKHINKIENVEKVKHTIKEFWPAYITIIMAIIYFSFSILGLMKT